MTQASFFLVGNNDADAAGVAPFGVPHRANSRRNLTSAVIVVANPILSDFVKITKIKEK